MKSILFSIAMIISFGFLVMFAYNGFEGLLFFIPESKTHMDPDGEETSLRTSIAILLSMIFPIVIIGLYCVYYSRIEKKREELEKLKELFLRREISAYYLAQKYFIIKEKELMGKDFDPNLIEYCEEDEICYLETVISKLNTKKKNQNKIKVVYDIIDGLKEDTEDIGFDESFDFYESLSENQMRKLRKDNGVINEIVRLKN